MKDTYDAFLLMIGDREAFEWIVSSSQMAFTSRSMPISRKLSPGTRLYLYTTRGCFKNPTRDRGRVVGKAQVSSNPTVMPKPVTFGEREFQISCKLSISGLTPFGAGVELASLVRSLDLFPDPGSWTSRIRRTLVPLNAHDQSIVERELSPLLTNPQIAFRTYVPRIHPRR